MSNNSAERRVTIAFCGLRWSLATVVLIESALFLFAPGSRHAFASTHLPGGIRLALGWAEIIGALLLLFPRTLRAGGWPFWFISYME